MKLNKQTMQSFVTAAALLLALVAGVYGVKLPEVPDYPDLSSVISVQEFGAGGEGLRAGVRERISIDAREDVYLYNGADFYMYSNDHSTQKLHLDGATGNIDAEGTLDVAGAVTLAGNIGAVDVSASGDLYVADDATITRTLTLGDLAVGGGYGSTGCSISDAGVLQCDGAATVASASMAGALSADDGTFTGALGADSLTVTGTIQYGSLYPMGFASDGYQMVLGSSTVTTTTAIVHGLTTPVYGFCTMSGSLTDNEEQKCSVGISGSDVTIYVWKEDGTAGDSGVLVFWQVFGTP